MNNPFYVAPLGGHSPVQGLGMMQQGMQMRRENQRYDAEMQRRAQAKIEIQAAYDSNDVNKVAEVSIKYPELSKSLAGLIGYRNKETKDNDQQTSYKIIGDPANTEKYLQEHADFITSQGGDPTGTLKDIQLFKSNPANYVKGREVMAASIDGKGLLDFKKSLGSGEMDDNLLKIKEETRKDVRTKTNKYRAAAAVITSNRDKLANLIKRIELGDRYAVSQSLVALVKIGDPASIVSVNEMEGALNTEDPISTVAKLLLSKGAPQEVIDSITTKLDLLNPENINTEHLMATADAMMSSSIPALQSQFEEARDLAAENLTDDGYNSIFNKPLIDAMGGLSEYLPDVALPDGVTEDDIKHTMKKHNLTREQVLERLQ